MCKNMQMIRWYDNWMNDKDVRMKQWDEIVRKKNISKSIIMEYPQYMQLKAVMNGKISPYN